MSSAEDFYSSRPTSTLYNSNNPPDLHKPEPPPPPPPKSTSHEVSRQGTPAQTGPPLPPLPQGQHAVDHASSVRSTPQPSHNGPPYHSQQEGRDPPIPPPSTSENWVPAVLQNKHTSDLGPILSDPTLLSALAGSHPSYASSQTPLSSQLSTNISLATRAQETALHLARLREQTQALLLQHTNLSTQWRRKQSEMDKALEPWSPKAMYQRLVAGTAEQEAVVRAIEESFLEGTSHRAPDEDFYGGGPSDHGSRAKASEREVSDWVKRVRDNVQTLEMRKEMRERWDEGRVGGWR